MIMEAASSALPHLRGVWLWLARVIWVLIALLSISLFIVGTVAQYDNIRRPCGAVPLEAQSKCWPTENALHELGLTWDDLANFYTPIATVAALPFILLGFLVFWRKSGNSLGLLFSLVLVVAGSAGVNQYLSSDLLPFYPGLVIPMAIITFLGGTAIALLACLFPDGRFVPNWMRWWLIVMIARSLQFSLPASPVSSFLASLWGGFFNPTVNALLLIAFICAIVFRYQHDAGPVQRQQIKWVVVAMVIVGILQNGFNIIEHFWRPGFVDLFLFMVYSPLFYLGVLFAAVCIGISISRYRLWDIDFLINRTLVYSLLTACIVGIYVIVVGVLGTTIQGHSNLLISILATGLVAVLVQPLRDNLQRGINRLMYGERDNPATVLSQLGQRLENTLAPDAVLPTLVETVAQTLKLPYVAIETNTDNYLNSPPITAYGKPQSDMVCLPLIYQSEAIGQLLVSPRAHGEPLSPMDRHLLDNIAHQSGMVVHAVNLTADLQRSRQRLVIAREEERRRLRRDLHDGLGPNLASQGLKLAAVRQLLESNPVSAEALLDQVMAQNQATVEEIRRLVYGLHPPALDELGLVAAIRDHVAGMDEKASLQVMVREPARGLPLLSAAVEVAAYRIVLEALTNVIRHAQANRCLIQFSLDAKDSRSALQIKIQDDGIGLPNTHRMGVGTRSMRERAEEVGGTCVIESKKDHGTRVCVQIPLTVV